MKRRTPWVIGAAVVVVGVGVALLWPHRGVHPTAVRPVHHQNRISRTTPAKAVSPDHRIKAAVTVPTPTIPRPGTSTGSSAQASLAALTKHEGVDRPVGPIDVVQNVGQPSQTWAFSTEAAKGASTGYTLWFGEQDTPTGPWTWIPSTLPGALSSQLPPAVHSALQWAYDLHAGQTGPTLLGTVSWNAIKGLVGEPAGWTVQESNGQLTLTVWEPSYTGTFTGYYGVQSAWYPSTIRAGQSGLSMIIAHPGPMALIAQTNAS